MLVFKLGHLAQVRWCIHYTAVMFSTIVNKKFKFLTHMNEYCAQTINGVVLLHEPLLFMYYIIVMQVPGSMYFGEMCECNNFQCGVDTRQHFCSGKEEMLAHPLHIHMVCNLFSANIF